MSNDLNQCQFIGRLGRDVDLRFTPDNQAVANFSLACGWESRDKDGGKKEGTEWLNVAVYGKLAELCSQYISKGSMIFLQGRLRTEKYIDKTSGQEKTSTRIVADKIQFLSSPNKTDKPAEPAEPKPVPESFDDFESDIPF